jgi:hypothetical protein
MSKEQRSLKKLILDFESSRGEFLKFHSGMNKGEKIMFKEWINSMRKEIPRFASHKDNSEIFQKINL